jgi:hypothetical protein
MVMPRSGANSRSAKVAVVHPSPASIRGAHASKRLGRALPGRLSQLRPHPRRARQQAAGLVPYPGQSIQTTGSSEARTPVSAGVVPYSWRLSQVRVHPRRARQQALGSCPTRTFIPTPASSEARTQVSAGVVPYSWRLSQLRTRPTRVATRWCLDSWRTPDRPAPMRSYLKRMPIAGANIPALTGVRASDQALLDLDDLRLVAAWGSARLSCAGVQ